jgi:hypothetical protein
LAGELVAEGQGDENGEPHEGGEKGHPHKAGTPAQVHEEENHQRGFADCDGQGCEGIPFAEVDECHACGEGGQPDQRRENNNIESLVYDVANHQ